MGLCGGGSREKTKRKLVNRSRARGYMRRSWGHRTHLSWHRTRPVPTGLKHREGCKTRNHQTIPTRRSPIVRCHKARHGEHQTHHTGRAQCTVRGFGGMARRMARPLPENAGSGRGGVGVYKILALTPHCLPCHCLQAFHSHLLQPPAPF